MMYHYKNESNENAFCVNLSIQVSYCEEIYCTGTHKHIFHRLPLTVNNNT